MALTSAPEAPVLQTFRERRPAPALSRHVGCVWIQEVSPDSSSFAHRKTPTGGVELVCALGEMPRVLGPQSGPAEQTLTPGTTVVGVRLRPEAASCVLGVPGSALVDLDLAADELWDGHGRALHERLAGARSAEHAAALLEGAVAGRLDRAPDPVVAEAVRRLTSGQGTEVASLASSLTISERQLRRRFAAAVGLTPKTLHRVLRFQRFLALAWAHPRPSADLARLAAEAGYADQAHLTREAARLEGRSPRTFVRELEQRCGCGHDHSASYGPLLRGRV